jgi:serralysin
MVILQPTAEEQYLLELINRARANPQYEVAANPHVSSLNDNLPPGTLDAGAKPPLAFESALIKASRSHSRWMLDADVFSHTGNDGSDAGKRMVDAGYRFVGASSWGENLSWQGTTGNLDVAKSIEIQHNGLFQSPIHRRNLMNREYKEIGLGVLTGNFKGYNTAMITQNFAVTGNQAFLTGVIYNDAIVDDDFYTIGEAVSDISIKAVRQSDGESFSTTNFVSGGYSLALEPGIYTVTFSGEDLNRSVTQTVTIGETNVKLDLATDALVDVSRAVFDAGMADDLAVTASAPGQEALAENTVASPEVAEGSTRQSIWRQLQAQRFNLGTADGIHVLRWNRP